MSAPEPRPEPPASLNEAAAARWRHVIDELKYQRLDLELLETYCQVWARWREAEAAIAKTGTLVKKARGGVGANPLLAISNQAGAQVRALEQRLGLTREPARKSEPISLRAYAKRRGVSVEAVSRAITRGRLLNSVTRIAGVPKIADPELADQEWDANTDLSRAPDAVKARAAAGSGATAGDVGPGDDFEGESEAQAGRELAAASAREKHWRAQTAELNYKVRAGELVNAKEMAAAMADAFSTVRTKLLALPSQAKQRLPHLTLDDLATLEELVREDLDALSSGDGATS